MPIITNNIQRGTLVKGVHGISRAYEGGVCVYQKIVPFSFGGWVSNSGIISGLSYMGDSLTPTVFHLNDETYLIGDTFGQYYGWKAE